MAMSRKRKPGIFNWLSPRNLVYEVNRYGYHFSLLGFWKFYLLALVSIFVISIIYQLQLPYILAVSIFSLFLSPFIILNTYQNMYQQKRFLDVTNYLEQLLYSFRKGPKILTSLQDTLAVFPEGQMHDHILKVMDAIQNKPIGEGGDLYRDAFLEMEESYGCRRMRQAHEFLIKVENFGGEFNGAIDILLEDRRMWIERVYELEKNRSNLKVKITISLALSFLICGLTMFMLPKDFQTLGNGLSQAATMSLMISNIIIWYVGQKKLSVDWLNDLEENCEEIQRCYDRVMKQNPKKERQKSFFMAGICLIICAAGTILQNIPVTVIGASAVIYALMQPGMGLKMAKKRMVREVDKAFPIWIMEMSLLLQTDNPQVALTKSVDRAPYVLREDLRKLVDNIEKNPAAIEPYLGFMSGFDLPDVQSVLRMLYSMSESGSEDFKNQIIFLVERNNRLLDKSERIINEDKTAGTGMLVLIPMVTGSLKMMTDLGVFLMSLLNLTQGM